MRILNPRNIVFSIFIFFVVFLQEASAQKVKLGIDVLQYDNFRLLAGKHVGLITNHTGLNSKLISTLDIFRAAKNFTLAAVFSPEHGLKGNIGASQKYSNSTDSLSGIKYYSLYGSTQKPTKEMLTGIDVLVYDIQDTGIRSYTYISTLGLAMEAAAENNIEFVVLDRPNPLGGLRVEGNPVEDDYISFVGHFKIPYVYGLTCGELAQLLNNEKLLLKGEKCTLSIVRMENWFRGMDYRHTGLIWVPTSPNVPTPETPFYMVATGILGELVTVGIGVTYTLPFETFAAEWIDADSLAKYMNDLNLPGVLFRPISYKPLYGMWQDKNMNGVQIHFTDVSKVNLIELQFYFMQVNHQLYPDKNPFDLSTNTRLNMFDKVLGTNKIRQVFSKRFLVKDIHELLNNGVDEFRKLSLKYYLY
jgi:uncharacterized protein YbbC (DUF1343 family)